MKKLIFSIIFLIVFSIFVSAKSFDVNTNGHVGTDDVGAVNNNLGSNDMTYDVNNDGIVNELDIGAINSFRENCPPLYICDCSIVECDPDKDNDGIFNEFDKCPDTSENEIVIKDISSPYYGCSECEIDSDEDTIMDCNDNCPNEYGEGTDGCPSDVAVTGTDLIVPYGFLVYSNQINDVYNNILISGQLDVIPYTGFSLTARNDFILDTEDSSIINANGDIGMPGKDVSLYANYFEIEGIPIEFEGKSFTQELRTEKIYTVNNIDYKILAAGTFEKFKVSFIINKEETPLISIGEEYTLKNGAILKVLNLIRKTAFDVFIGDDNIYTANGYGGISKFDKDLNFIKNYDNINYVNSIFVADNFVYVTAGENGILKFDKDLNFIKTYDKDGMDWAVDVFVDNGYIYVTDVKVLKLDKDLNFIKSYDDIVNPYGIFVDNEHVYVTDIQGDLLKLDKELNLIKNYDTSGNPVDIFVDKEYVYVIDNNIQKNEYKLLKLDKDLNLINSYKINDGYANIFVDNEYIYVTDYYEGLLKLDKNLNLIDSYGTINSHDMFVDNDFIYIANDKNGILKLDKDLGLIKNYNTGFGNTVTFTIVSKERDTRTSPHAALINKHIQRQPNDGGITKQCSSGEILTKECGLCGNRLKQCTSDGIWDLTWSNCEGQGYCDPLENVPSVLIKDTHRINNCEDNKVQYVKTYQTKECDDDCSYTNVQEIDEHVSWECNTGYCTATCSGTLTGECGRCGILDCQNCQEVCVGEGICTPGTKRVSICSDCNEVMYETCVGCEWELEKECGAPITEPGCNPSTYLSTKECGYCGKQTCLKTCDKTNPVYYWSSCENEYFGNDKCLPGQEIEKQKQTNRESCAGKLLKKVDVYQNKLCPSSCKLNEAEWTGNEIIKNERKTAVKGECGYDCDNNEQRTSGKGICQQVETCQDNKWEVTQSASSPTSEICGNGKDDNCNGQKDEDCTNVKKHSEQQNPSGIYDVGGCGDFDNDNVASSSDFMKIRSFYNKIGPLQLNYNKDNKIDGVDLFCFMKQVGKNINCPKDTIKCDCSTVKTYNGDVKDYVEAGGSLDENSLQYHCFLKDYKTSLNYNCNYGCSDINGDGIVALNDMMMIIDANGKCKGMPGYNEKADRDGDGCVFTGFSQYYTVDSPDALCTLAELGEEVDCRITNLALNKKTEATTYVKYGGDFSPKIAVDGKIGTRWASERAEYWKGWKVSSDKPQSLTVDLGKEYNINKVELVLYSKRYEQNYDLQYSTDKINWETIDSKSNAYGKITHKFETKTARYWRVSITDSKDDGQANIFEFKIFGY